METPFVAELCQFVLAVPPSGGSLEIGNSKHYFVKDSTTRVPPSGGSLEIGNRFFIVVLLIEKCGSPFGGISRNWKLEVASQFGPIKTVGVPPSGGSLEIGNLM